MKKHSIFWGIILLGSGVLLLLNALGIGTGFGLVPLVGSLLLLAVSVFSFSDLNFVFGLLPLAGIAYIWRKELGQPDMNIWLLLGSAVLLGIGLSVIFWKAKKNREKSHCGHEEWFEDHKDWKSAETITSTDESEVVNINSSFGEQIRYIRSANLKRVNITTNFASAKVYFDQCQVSPEGASIYVDCSFAGVFLYVPRTWNIDNQAHSSFGSVEGASVSAASGLTTVTLQGNVHFGSVKIIYI